MTYKELIEICKTCKHRTKYDDMWHSAWWSHCQTDCKLIIQAREDDGLKGRRSFEQE